MAAITRRTWDLIEDEFILRAGRENDTNFPTRAQYFLTAAYLWIAKATHHHELEVTSNALALNTSDNTVDISTLFPCIVQGVELQSAAGDFMKLLRPAHLTMISGRYNATAGVPTYFTQHGEDLLVDRLPDAVYKLNIYYLDVEPTLPDFGAAAESPATGQAWDEAILELGLLLAHSGVGRHDVAAAHSQIYQLFAGEMPQPRTAEDTQRGVYEATKTNVTLGGAHG